MEIFDLLRLRIAGFSSSDTQEVHWADFSIQMNETWRRGRQDVWARSAISRRIGSVNVMPVDPARRSALEKQAKSECEHPYGPDTNARCFGSCGWPVSPWSPEVERLAVEGLEISLTRRIDSLDEVADAFSLPVNPSWALSMNSRSPLCEAGVDSMVAGCDCKIPKRGTDSRTCWPACQFFSRKDCIRTFETPPGKAVTVARPRRLLW